MQLSQAELENIKMEAVLPMITTARKKTWQAVKDIQKIVKPGMTEKQAIQKANEYFANQGVRKFWHRTHIRFGQSTVLSFDDDYNDNVILKENDIFYVDVGPVWGNIEGDCGNTFVIGHNPEHLKIKEAVKTLFLEAEDHWNKTNISGAKLYEFVQIQAEKMGYIMHPTYVKGHRLSEFSHSKYSDVGVFDLDFKPSKERWILELQICHPSLEFGAFYEDLLGIHDDSSQHFEQTH